VATRFLRCLAGPNPDPDRASRRRRATVKRNRKPPLFNAPANQVRSGKAIATCPAFEGAAKPGDRRGPQSRFAFAAGEMGTAFNSRA
jgi:hypothetical protein